MVAISARLVPHIMRAWVWLLFGFTVTLLPSTVACTRSVSGSLSSPSLPVAVTTPPAMATCTPAGISTGYFPTRDIRAFPLEHAAEDFAANIGGACLGIAHHTARRGKDRNTQTGIDPGQFLNLRVHAAAGLGDGADLLVNRLPFFFFRSVARVV